ASSMYGVFFEEINHAGDGGIYSELVKNRSFREGMKGWKATGMVDSGLKTGPRPSIRLASQASVQLENEGYFGVPVRRAEIYNLRIEAMGQLKGPLRAALLDAAGKEIASAKVPVTPGWKMHEVKLVALKTEGKARLVLTASGETDIEFRYVSLMPRNTWKGHGLRPDLAQMVADMKPAFIRFPGGCFVEGDSIANAHRWKRTIGPIELREGRQGVWGYRSTDGLGFHEYLQWCEDSGAEPLYVSNVGMACQFRSKETVPLSELDEWIGDALDAIEYANGPVTSKWGAERAKNGHPKPFGMKYIEVGNENWGPEYDARYARFYDAIRAKYPAMQIIVDVMGTKPTSRSADIQDEHFYESTNWFANQHRRYDTHDRKGPKVYVGEYAVTKGAGTGNLNAALGEAAFMIGMERNSDVVTMTSYAPLFVHSEDRAWNPDAIVFNGLEAYGTPSYWNQWLFSRNGRGVSLPVNWADKSQKVVEPQGRGVGMGTWGTSAEFRNLKIDGVRPTTFTGDGLKGTWTTTVGGMKHEGDDKPAMILYPNPAGGDFTLTVQAKKLGGEEGFLIPFRVRSATQYSWWNIGGWNNTRTAVEHFDNGSGGEASRPVDMKIETGRWYDIRIEGRGDRIRCYIDDALIHDYREPQVPEIVAGASRDGKTVTVKVVNLSGDTMEREIHLDGTGTWRGKDETVLTSKSPQDENSFSNPKLIAPKTQSLSFKGNRLTHKFLPWSVTFLRFEQ
ncbi:alpha-N-arabinofuranosidase, partial [bacterium]